MELLKKQAINNEKFKTGVLNLILRYKNTLMLGVISFFISRLSFLGSISPLALTFSLVCKGNLFVVLSGILGILSNGSANSYKYILMLLFGISVYRLIRLSFKQISVKKASPIIIFFTTLLFNLIFVLFKEYVIYDVILAIFESFIAGVFFFIFHKGIASISSLSKKKFFTSEEIFASLIILTLIIAGIGTPLIPFNISLKNITCIFAVLVSGAFGNLGISAQISAFMGIAAGISSDYFGVFLAVYSVNGLISSIFSKYGRIANVLGFTLGNVIMSVFLAHKYYMVISFIDIAISSVIFVLIPESLFNKILSALLKKSKDYDKAYAIKNIATVKLDRLSIAFRKLSDTINTTINKTNKANLNNIGTLFDAVADKVCKKCAMRFYCWQKDYDTTMEAMLKIAKSIEKHGSATKDDFPDYFIKKCVKTNDILSALINLYEIFRLNLVWQNKMKDNARLYREQFLELSDIVLNLKEEIERNPYFDKNLSLEISSELEKEGISVKNVNVIKDFNENMEIEISLFPCQQKDKCYRYIEKNLEEIIGVPFYKFSGKCSYRECNLVFKESEIYMLKHSVKQATKPNSEKSGDSYSIRTLENSTQYIALCDGCGSGKSASMYSGSTLRLLEEFLKTGFSKTASIKLINSSLLSNADNDYFSTIDLSIIDLKSGEIEMIKKGACPTYIMKANGEFETIKSVSMPIGVVGSDKSNVRKTKLCENDIIVMISDGIVDCIEKEDWIIDALKAIKSDDPDYIAEIILKIALSTENKDKDDMTVIVSKVMQNV